MLKIIIASGPVIVENGKVLLNKHGDDNFWKFCGGKVEDYNTNLADNAKREVKEEMGIDIDVLDKKPYIMHITKETPDGDMDIILVHFLAKGSERSIRARTYANGIGLTSVIFRKTFAPNIKPVLEHFKSNNQSYNFLPPCRTVVPWRFYFYLTFSNYMIL